MPEELPGEKKKKRRMLLLWPYVSLFLNWECYAEKLPSASSQSRVCVFGTVPEGSALEFHCRGDTGEMLGKD